jgi:hypothetical protein
VRGGQAASGARATRGLRRPSLDARNLRQPGHPRFEGEWNSNGRRTIQLFSSMRAMEDSPITCLRGEEEKTLLDGVPQFELVPTPVC